MALNSASETTGLEDGQKDDLSGIPEADAKRNPVDNEEPKRKNSTSSRVQFRLSDDANTFVAPSGLRLRPGAPVLPEKDIESAAKRIRLTSESPDVVPKKRPNFPQETSKSCESNSVSAPAEIEGRRTASHDQHIPQPPKTAFRKPDTPRPLARNVSFFKKMSAPLPEISPEHVTSKENEAPSVVDPPKIDSIVNDACAKLMGKIRVLEADVADYKTFISKLLRSITEENRAKDLRKVQENYLRLGRFVSRLKNDAYTNEWQDGIAMRNLEEKMRNLAAIKRSAEEKEKELRRRRRADGAVFVAPHGGVDDFLHIELDIVKMRLSNLKNEEKVLLEEKDRLVREINVHVKEDTRLKDETSSVYKDFPKFSDGRYLFLSLLGKGGFSEVWKAYDFNSKGYVACKLHKVSSDWSEPRKANYVKRAMREKEIQKSLRHPHIVQSCDLFVIDNSCFCSVLEYCDGYDLDFYLKQYKSIGEKETRMIIIQVLSALKYMNELPTPIIHYDLKPANILFIKNNSLEVKITDFGLSKIVETDSGDVSLTSPGAGTYWYLPPEVFQAGATPYISSKVDVWSVGVIFFQCIFGFRPFGRNVSQQQVAQRWSQLQENHLDIPASPKSSESAKVSFDIIAKIKICRISSAHVSLIKKNSDHQ